MDTPTNPPAPADQALAEARRVGFEFLLSLNHELRTPMGALLGFSALLQETDLSVEQRRDACEKIHWAAYELLRLQNMITDIAKIETGRFQLEPAPFDPQECIQQVLAATANYVNKSRINVTSRSNPDIVSLVGDKGWIIQALIPIVRDAIIYAEKDQPVAISTESHQDHNGNVIFTISYRSKQSSNDKLKSHKDWLIQEFQQTDKWPYGFDVELVLSKLLCNQMGGRIWVEGNQESNDIQVKVLVPSLAAEESTIGPG